MSDFKGRDRRQFSRVPLEKQVEFYIDEDILSARTADHSASGMRITAEQPITIFLRTIIDGELIEREARFIWARTAEEGAVEYGFEYTDED